MSWRRLLSRCGVPTAPRKYFVVTMLVALMLHSAGNSTPRCSKLIEPSRQLVMTTSRRSHSTSSYGWTPSVVQTRATRSPPTGALPLARLRCRPAVMPSPAIGAPPRWYCLLVVARRTLLLAVSCACRPASAAPVRSSCPGGTTTSAAPRLLLTVDPGCAPGRSRRDGVPHGRIARRGLLADGRRIPSVGRL